MLFQYGCNDRYAFPDALGIFYRSNQSAQWLVFSLGFIMTQCATYFHSFSLSQ